MSRRRRHRSSPFVMIRHDLLKDPGWQKLSNSAKVLYIYLRAKFNYKTYSEVTLAYSEMKGVMSTRTMSRAFKELLREKWIIKTKQGGIIWWSLCLYIYR